MTQTGANADEWVPAKPGTEGVLALGLANVIIAAGLHPAEAAGRSGALIDGWSSGLSAYTPAQVEKVTGVAASRVERLARQFADTRPAVAIIGGPPLAHTNGLFSALAVNALNALVGSVEQPGGVFFTPQLNLCRGGASVAVAAAATARSFAADICPAARGAAGAASSTERIPSTRHREHGRSARRSRRSRSSRASAAFWMTRASWRT
jgi:anaerobic selenocysteine-containing dehydrogenase